MIFCSTNMMHHVFIIFFNLKFNLYSNNGTWDMEKLSCMLLMRTKKVHFLYPDAFKKPACPRPRLNTMNRTLFIYFVFTYPFIRFIPTGYRYITVEVLCSLLYLFFYSEINVFIYLPFTFFQSFPTADFSL